MLSLYMLISQRFAGLIEYSFPAVRPILLSFISAPFLNFGELFPRLLMLTFSILSVFGMYLLGKEAINKRVGIIGTQE